MYESSLPQRKKKDRNVLNEPTDRQCDLRLIGQRGEKMVILSPFETAEVSDIRSFLGGLCLSGSCRAAIWFTNLRLTHPHSCLHSSHARSCFSRMPFTLIFIIRKTMTCVKWREQSYHEIVVLKYYNNHLE